LSILQLKVTNTKLATELTVLRERYVYERRSAEEEKRGLEKEIRAWEAKRNSKLGGQNAKNDTPHSPFPLLTPKPVITPSRRTKTASHVPTLHQCMP
jgi:hypothetical protein